MTLYLVTDANDGTGTLVESARMRGAINAVVQSRFTACEVSQIEAYRLGARGTPLLEDGSEEEVPAPEVGLEPPPVLQQNSAATATPPPEVNAAEPGEAVEHHDPAAIVSPEPLAPAGESGKSLFERMSAIANAAEEKTVDDDVEVAVD